MKSSVLAAAEFSLLSFESQLGGAHGSRRRFCSHLRGRVLPDSLVAFWHQPFIMNNKAMSVAMLVVGIILLIWGINALDSFSSDVSRFFTGSPTDKAVWLMIGGIGAAIVGLFGVLRGAKGG